MRCESGVNVSRFSAPLVGSPGKSCVAEKTKSQRDEETKRLRVKKTKRRREEETKGQRDEETKRQRVKETKGQKDEKTKRRRDEERKGREDENRVTSYSPPIRVVSSSPPNSFNSYSIRVQKHLRDSCPKQFYTIEHRFVRGR